MKTNKNKQYEHRFAVAEYRNSVHCIDIVPFNLNFQFARTSATVYIRTALHLPTAYVSIVKEK